MPAFRSDHDAGAGHSGALLAGGSGVGQALDDAGWAGAHKQGSSTPSHELSLRVYGFPVTPGSAHDTTFPKCVVGGGPWFSANVVIPRRPAC